MVLSDACVRGLCPSCIQDAHVIPASRKRRQVETRVRQCFASNTCYIGRVENKLYASKPLCEVRADVTLGCRGLPLFCIFCHGEPLAGFLSAANALSSMKTTLFTKRCLIVKRFPFLFIDTRASRVFTQLTSYITISTIPATIVSSRIIVLIIMAIIAAYVIHHMP